MIEKVQVWIVSAEKRILLLQTTAERGGYWQPVTGGVESGESHLEAAIREANEETGMTRDLLRGCRALGAECVFDGRWGQAHEVCFGIVLPALPDGRDPVVLWDPREHQGARWVSVSEVESLLTFESNRMGFIALKNALLNI